MSLNISKGDMYDFVTHTWNTIKGECPHKCSYCYMHRWGNQKPVRFDAKELKTDLGGGNFIFVGSSCDLFADAIPEEWISATLQKCWDYRGNEYLFQTKNPERLRANEIVLPPRSVVCTTIETNRWQSGIMGRSPHPHERAIFMSNISHHAILMAINIFKGSNINVPTIGASTIPE